MTEGVFRSGQTGAERKFGTDVSKQRPCRARWEYLTSCARWRQARKTALAQLRPQGRNGRNGEVRGPHPGACREPPRHGGTGGTRCSSSRRALREQIVILHRRLLAIVRNDEVCRRLMTTPGVGPVVALTYRAAVDVPARFRKSKAGGAVFGLTCARYQSGEIDAEYRAAETR
jgi:transposase